MYVLRQFAIFCVLIFWILGLELVRRNHGYLFWIAGFLSLFLFLTLWFISWGKNYKTFWHFVILPLSFALAAFLLMLFVIDPMVFHVLAVGEGLILYVLFRQYYVYFHFPNRYQPYSLESLTLYITIAAMFLFFGAGFAAATLLQIKIYWLLLSFAPFLFLLFYQFFWMHKIDWKQNWIMVLVSDFILLELALAAIYLPTGYYVNAFILTVCAYLLLDIGKLSMREALTRRALASHISVAAALLLIVLFTAKWS